MLAIILGASLATLGLTQTNPASTVQDGLSSTAPDNTNARAPTEENHVNSSSISDVNTVPTEDNVAGAARDYDPLLQSRFLIGVGPEEWNSLDSLNQKYGMNMNLATSWINSHEDLYGWWNNSFFPETLWSKGNVPHIITWGYIEHSWNVDYSAENLTKVKQLWLDDLAFMASRLKAPDDGQHLVLISLETECNDYLNMNHTYWNQLMIESKNVIKQVAPNVRVSYCIGGWAWRGGGDISRNGVLAESMREMDFMSFQCMWGAYGSDQYSWMNGDDLKSSYGGVNWTRQFGPKPNVWNYMIDDIINNVKALSKYNKNILLAHFSIDNHLWGLQSQIDVLSDISDNFGQLKALGLFGISWMRYYDERLDEWAYWSGDIGAKTGGFQYPNGSPKPCLSEWVHLVNSIHD